MGRSSREERQSTRLTWETLETWVRVKVQEFVQAVLEEEVTEALGRRRYERRDGVDAPVGHRNGYGKPRWLALQTETIMVRRPRVRGLEERFESRLVPLFVRRSEQVADLLPELYLHGLAQGDFELALRGLLGDGAPLSAKTISGAGGWIPRTGASDAHLHGQVVRHDPRRLVCRSPRRNRDLRLKSLELRVARTIC